MSMPTGTYIIYNRVLSPTGDKLAITFKGNNQAVTVEPLVNGNTSQLVCSYDYKLGFIDDICCQWTIGAPLGIYNAQPISPIDSPRFQAGTTQGQTTIHAIPANDYVYKIEQGSAGYSIQTADKAIDWNLQSASVGSMVALTAHLDVTPGSEPEKFRWIVQRV